jgi:hypothetical protein
MRGPAFVALLAVVALLLAACGADAPPAADVPVSPAAARDAVVIRSLDIEAPLTLKQFQSGAPLPSPDGPHDVVLYDFGGLRDLGGAPGEGGNVVLSGRSISDVGCVRAEPPCNGVFLRLRFIAPGERVDVSWRGSSYRYQVVSVCGVVAAQFSDRLYMRSAEEQLTLITGVGTLGPSGFPIVLVVTAKPAPVTAGEACPAGTLPIAPP